MTSPPRRPVRFRRLRFGVLEACVVGVLATTFAVVARPAADVRVRVARELEAKALVDRLVEAQAEMRRRATIDANADGVAEYATLEELRAAGLAPPAAPEGYLLDVLLPLELLPDGRRRLVAGRGDPVESAQDFAVVARPRTRADGLRSFYRDATGARYETEGVADASESDHPPLPATTLAGGEDLTNPGPVWRAIGPPREAVPTR